MGATAASQVSVLVTMYAFCNHRNLIMLRDLMPRRSTTDSDGLERDDTTDSDELEQDDAMAGMFDVPGQFLIQGPTPNLHVNELNLLEFPIGPVGMVRLFEHCAAVWCFA